MKDHQSPSWDFYSLIPNEKDDILMNYNGEERRTEPNESNL
jgi:hypothetical protein